MFKDKQVKRMTLRQVLIIITYTILLITAMMNMQSLYGGFLKVMALIRPFIYGLALAYVFNLPLKYFLRKLPSNVRKGRKCIAVLLSFLVIFLVFAFIFQIVVPQVANSIMSLIESFPDYIRSTQETATRIMNNLDINEQVMAQINTYSVQIQDTILSIVSSIIPRLIETTMGVTSSIANLFLSIVIAVYFSISKDKLLRQSKKASYALLPQKIFDYIMHIATLANKTFSNFISGQMVEAVIIGVLCYIGSLILQIPYAPILAVIIGCTNIIPIFGPIIGTGICAFLIMFVSPIDAVIFIIFGICLQQFESNLIYPRVVGSSVGLSGLWVLFAITVGGGVFGLIGMVLGLPTFAVIYTLFSEEVNRRFLLKEASKLKVEEVVEVCIEEG